MAYPKIVYNSGVVLNFTYPPINKPNQDELDAERSDTDTIAGARQSVWWRTDVYKTIQVEYVPHIDGDDWAVFFDWAVQGQPFDYYKDADLPNYATYTMEGNNWKSTFNFKEHDKFTLKMRKVVDSDAPPVVPIPDPQPSTPPATTTAASVFNNNTSASSNYIPNSTIATIRANFASATATRDLSGNLPAGNVSKQSIKKLVYDKTGVNVTTKFFAALLPFHVLGGNNDHVDVGYEQNNQTQVNRQIEDAVSRGLDGFSLAWYGPNNAHHNGVAQKLKIGAEADGDFLFNLRVNSMSLNGYTNKTEGLKTILDYANLHYFSSANYHKYGNQPVILFFDLELVPGINWDSVRTHVQGYETEPLFIFRNANGLDADQSNGCFAWLDTSASGTYRRNYLTDFYPQVADAILKFGSCYKGFDDSLADWGTGRFIDDGDGQCWLDTFDILNSFYDQDNQIPFVILPTWNDYAEGTALETGVPNGLTITLNRGNPSTMMGQGVNTTAIANPSQFPQCEAVRIWDTGCSWHHIATADGVYDWDDLDEIVDQAEAAGVPILYTFGRTPTWASSNPTQASAYGNNGNAAKPTSNVKFTDFVTALVTRYAGRIEAYEMWNEPNHSGYWTGTINELYTMVGLGYAAAKAADPTCIVTTPCPTWGNTTYDNSWEWLDAWFDLGGDAYADNVVTFHGYVDSSSPGYQPEEVGTIIDQIRTVMTDHSLGSWELWDTESGWDLNSKLPDADKVDWIEGWIQIRRDKGLDRMYWYQWNNTTRGTCYAGGALTAAGTRWVLRLGDAAGDDLEWVITGNDNVINQYKVYELINNSGTTLNFLANVAVGVNSYTPTGLAAGTHKFYVQAECKACFRNAESNGVFITI